jgi:hypothetical protein
VKDKGERKSERKTRRGMAQKEDKEDNDKEEEKAWV